MNKLTLGTLCIMFLFSCTNNIIEEHEYLNSEKFGENDEMQSKLFKAGGDNLYDFLGYGYDATGTLAHPRSTRGQVIDLVKLRALSSTALSVDNSKYITSKVVKGENSIDYVKNLSADLSLDVTISKLGLDLFTGKITSAYSRSESYSNAYSFASYDWLYVQKRVSIYASNEDLKSVLTESFYRNIQTMTGAQIVNVYGTHILTSINLGGKGEFIYKSRVISGNKSNSVTAGLVAGYKKAFNATINASYDNNQNINNKEEELYYNIYGGNPLIAPTGLIDLTSNTTSINLSPWQNSCNTTNMMMIQINPAGLLPIYELIDNPGKKEEVKQACIDYIRSKQITMQTSSPMQWPDCLRAGQIMHVGDCLKSSNGIYTLCMQSDGNLALYFEGRTKAIWAPNRYNSNRPYFALQTDGNMVLYGPNSYAYWSSGTSHVGNNAYLVLQTDGNLVLYNNAGRAVWSTGTHDPKKWP